MSRRPTIGAVGVFDVHDLHIVAPGVCEHRPISAPLTAHAAWDTARRLDLRQIWLTPGALAALGLPPELDRRNPESHPFLYSGSLGHPSSQTVLSPWLTFWAGDGERRMLEIAIPSWDRSSPFCSVAEFAPALAGEVGEFVEATGMLWRRNGQTTSDAWLRENLRKLRPTENPPPGDDGNLEADLKFVRPMTDAERKRRFVHAFDANAMYLGAASSLYLPVGDAEHNTDGDVYPVTMPGYWRYGDRWLTTPTARFEDRSAADEFYGFLEWHRFLEGWYRVLRDARTELLAAGPSPALDAVKATYRQGIGQLASHRKQPTDPLYQPYWRHAIQAEARTRLQRRIAKLTVEPLAVDVDCIYVVANIPDPTAVALRVGVPIGDGIGEFKVKGSARVGKVRAILDGNRGAMALGPLREEMAA